MSVRIQSTYTHTPIGQMILALKLMNKLMTFSNEDMMVVTARACAGAGDSSDNPGQID